ncbi:cerebellin-4-like [Babylonia areolata]|uniref:cerebellin-4-like n=1 Tax=Babylonia areolata TaxID=304850 RepID=UPI003FD64C88
MRTTPILILILFACYVTLTCTKRDAPRRDRNRNRNKNRNRKVKGVARHLSPVDGMAEAEAEEGCHLEVTCRNPNPAGVPLILPVQGPRGPPGKTGQPGQDGAPGLPGPTGGPQKAETRALSFFVGLQANQGPVSHNTDLIFDNVVTNVGQAFQAETGRFTAPYNGTFQFTVVVAAQGRQRAAVNLVTNARLVLTIWAESIPYWASATNSAILSLAAGDEVWLVLLARASYIHGYMYTTFSGAALFADWE